MAKTKWSFVKIFLLIGMAAVLASCLKLSIPLDTAPKPPNVSPNSVLLLEGFGPLAEANRGGLSILNFGKQDELLLDMIYSLRKAAVDERIRGVVLKLGDQQIGLAQAQDIREAIRDYRRSGKPIYAFAKLYGNMDYFIACACDKIFLMPYGAVFLNGFSATRTYFHSILEKMGIKIETIRFEKYKTAPETFTAEKMSEAEREQVSAYLDAVYQEFLDSVSRERGIEKSRLIELVDNGPQGFATALKEKGLIDDQKNVEEILAAFNLAKPAKIISSRDYKRVPAEKIGLNRGPAVAVIYANGTIVNGQDSSGVLSGRYSIGCETLSGHLQAARNDARIKAVILRIDSPGGDGLASEAILHEIALVKNVKPVIVSMGNVAGSGGYYIAALADAIVAEPLTLTGSIGVFMLKPDFSQLYEKIGVDRETIKRGKHSDLATMDRSLTQEEKDLITRLIGDFYQRFIQVVAEGRKKTKAEIERIAGGRIWSGKDARSNGLVDELGGILKALEVAKAKAGIPREQEVHLVLYPRRKNMIENLFNLPGKETISLGDAYLIELLPGLRPLAGLLESCLRQKGMSVMALMPYCLDIR